MLRKTLIILCLFLLPVTTTWAKEKTVTLTAVQVMQLAGNLVEQKEYDKAEQMLTTMPQTGNMALETERWFLLAQIASRRGDIETAIKIYRAILDDQPDLARVRFELAICYMHLKQWYRADYHLRLAMAGADLSDNVKRMMNYYRYIVRQNKNWNVWFNFGAAPDNNINNGTGGTECVNTIFGPMCRELIAPESALGLNFILGGNYEFKLSDHWRWKSDANIYTNIYNKRKFDDLYLSASTGPRYVWQNGDIWLAGVVGRRWYGGEKYYWSGGGKLDTNYDLTRKLSAGLSLRVLNNTYDTLGDWLNGQTYSANGRISYSLDATKYLILRGGIERETARDKIYANWRPSVGLGFGVALPWGFDAYTESSFYWTDYDGARWVVQDGAFTRKTAHDFNQRYSVSLSNHKFDIWGFVPTVTVAYTARTSNIWQREYDKWSAEFTFQQRF